MSDPGDRLLLISFGVSLGVHLFLLVSQAASLHWLSAPRSHPPLEVVYEHELAQQQLRHLQEQLARSARERSTPPTSAADLATHPQILIPDRPSLISRHSLSALMPRDGSVVDLTNLIEAARGDPIRLSYFSAIREQIQATANRRVWLTGAADSGLVYVSFLLTSSGVVKGVEVVSDRSASSHTLREVALQIVTHAAPFPPFPPSMVESSKTVVVPLDFLIES